MGRWGGGGQRGSNTSEAREQLDTKVENENQEREKFNSGEKGYLAKFCMLTQLAYKQIGLYGHLIYSDNISLSMS